MVGLSTFSDLWSASSRVSIIVDSRQILMLLPAPCPRSREMIVRLHHVGWAVADPGRFAEDVQRLFALEPIDQCARDGVAMYSIALPNDCWLQAVQDADPDSRVGRFIREHGEGLEHLALETDDLDRDVARLKELGVPIVEDASLDAPPGARAVLCVDDVIGFPVELIERSPAGTPDCGRVTNSNVLGLQHIGVAVTDVDRAAVRYEELFALKATGLRIDQHYGDQRDMMVEPGNDRLWLHLVETHVPDHRMYQFHQKHGPGLEHLCIEFADIREGVRRVQEAGVSFDQHKIFLDREDGFEAFVLAEHNHGVTVELIEPYPTSRGYRPNTPSTVA